MISLISEDIGRWCSHDYEAYVFNQYGACAIVLPTAQQYLYNLVAEHTVNEDHAMRTDKGQNWYKPMEIAQMGLIMNRKGMRGKLAGHYNFILEQIKSGKLKAVDYSADGDKPYYLVSEAAINDYHEKNN